LSIGTISKKVGYSTASYFIKQFRTAKGISPRLFRRQFRAGDTDIEDSEEDLNL
jgi:AraC-like DNA-binding protein